MREYIFAAHENHQLLNKWDELKQSEPGMFYLVSDEFEGTNTLRERASRCTSCRERTGWSQLVGMVLTGAQFCRGCYRLYTDLDATLQGGARHDNHVSKL